MSVHPKLSHIIGIPIHSISQFNDWKNKFYEELAEEHFWEKTKFIWETIENKDYVTYLKKIIKDKTLFNYVYFSDDCANEKIIGLKPVYDKEESALCGTNLMYTMIEAGLFSKTKTICTKINYEDYSSYLKMSKEEIKEINFKAYIELDNYQGQWARRYPHFPLYYYDKEFDFIYALLKSWGFQFSKNDLNRYLIFEWN